MSQAERSRFNILVDSGVPLCVTNSLWFGSVSRVPMMRHKKAWSAAAAAAVLNKNPEEVSGPQPLNTADMLCLRDSAVPRRSRPVGEPETWVRRRRRRSQAHRMLWGGKRSRTGTVWVVGGGNEPVLSPGPDLPIPHTVGRLRAGPCPWTETHTGQQIMCHVSCCCLNLTLCNTEAGRIHSISFIGDIFHNKNLTEGSIMKP